MKNKNKTNIERRFFESQVQIRKADDGSETRTIEGYGAVFNSWSKPMYGDWFKEKINRGAFDGVLNDEDTICRVHHNDMFVVGRNLKNLTLEVDEKGLRYTCDVPETTAGNDLLENIRAGIITKSSFAFTIKKQSWRKADKADDVEEYREIDQVAKLVDVAPVLIPAYDDTSVDATKRSYDNWKETQQPKQPEKENKHKAENRKRQLDLQEKAIRI